MGWGGYRLMGFDDEEPWDEVVFFEPEGIPEHKRILSAVFTACGYIMLIAGLSGLMALTAMVFQSALPGDSKSRQVVSSWPSNDPKGLAMRRAADAYNVRLNDSGQPFIGEPENSEDAVQGHTEDTDQKYLHALDMGGGIMGEVVIPKIGVDLTIRHGASNSILAQGAGHVYGTSLPVGGKGTHAVISAHRGTPDSMMFLRLDEMAKGDPFYIKTLGHTLGYRVTDIRVVKPDDVSSLRVHPGKDEVTLLTCTPFGVNTDRLLVTGERAGIPHEVPEPQPVKGDPAVLGVCAAILLLIPLMCLVVLFRRRPPARRLHASGITRSRGMHARRSS